MGTVIAWILGIATFIGGIAAIGYFRDKWHEKRQLSERDKVVNSSWWESSALRKEYEAQGFLDFSWSSPDRVAERISSGKEPVYEIDKKNKIKYRLVNKSGQVLMYKKAV